MIVRELFNKYVKELTKEEFKIYLKSLPSYKNKENYKKSFCYKYFGKRHKDLNIEELKLFNRIMKQRERTNKNDNL